MKESFVGAKSKRGDRESLKKNVKMCFFFLNSDKFPMWLLVAEGDTFTEMLHIFPAPLCCCCCVLYQHWARPLLTKLSLHGGSLSQYWLLAHSQQWEAGQCAAAGSILGPCCLPARPPALLLLLGLWWSSSYHHHPPHSIFTYTRQPPYPSQLLLQLGTGHQKKKKKKKRDGQGAL